MPAVGVLFFTVTLVVADPFPGGLPGMQIGSTLPGSYEPSGAVWHSRLQRLFVVSDGGTVTSMDADGAILDNWTVPGDLEGICVADPASNLIYLGVENPDSIREFDVTTGQVLRTFDLTATMQGPDNSGLEALTFVPDPQHPEGGLFYAGLQADGRIYVFDLPIRTSATSTSVAHVSTITPVSGRADISGMDFDRATGVLYAVFDSANAISAMDPDGTLLGDWFLPGNDQEGVAIRGCELFISEDVGPEVWRYGFPADPGDDDADGVTNCSDACPGTPGGTPVDPDGCGVPAACGGDAECNDGLFCTGQETCDPLSGCLPGTAPDCGSWSCSESLDQCVECLTGSDCAPGLVCSAATGACIVPPPASPLPVEYGDTWRYFAGVSDPPADWASTGFDESNWSSGPGGFGYGPDCAGPRGTVLDSMAGGYVSLYLRRTFLVADPGQLSTLTLTVDYDDAFVAYVNGVEVARDNVQGSPPAHSSLADADHECSDSTTSPNAPATFSISAALLVTGNNVLAIQGHNLSASSSDFSLIVELAEDAQPECSIDADCGDGVSCTSDVCQAGTCVHGGPDADGDAVYDCVDNCVGSANPTQQDFDGDGVGDACEVGAALVDTDRSGRVDGIDLAQFARAFAAGCGEGNYDAAADFDRDCAIDGDDLSMMATYFGDTVTAP